MNKTFGIGDMTHIQQRVQRAEALLRTARRAINDHEVIFTPSGDEDLIFADTLEMLELVQREVGEIFKVAYQVELALAARAVPQ